ncbi:MAG: hypothetical protein IPJ65_00415 [Archangiaceae bacterium]|nr:hypothetical protein [Archangiaceae bacterium]
MTDDVAELRRLLTQQADPSAVRAAVDRLERIDARLRVAEQTEERLQKLTESLFAVACRDFSKRPEVRGDATVIDAAAGSVLMLTEELQAHLLMRDRTEAELEARVTERSEQLLQASKMTSLGQLAAGMAHEINNPLAVILGFAQGLERRVPGTAPEFAKPVASIVREANRCKRLVEELLTFCRGDRRKKEALPVTALMQSAAALLEVRARTQDTRLTFDVPGDVPCVYGNRTQLEQVLINLGVNALDALQKGGNVRFLAQLTAPAQVTIVVSDDGPGIPLEVRPRIFEPFFTTKQVGKGTGLGLSISYEIVQQHGGSFAVDTTPGGGTTMTVRLPAAA